MSRESPQKSQNPNNFETLDKATVNTLKVSSLNLILARNLHLVSLLGVHFEVSQILSFIIIFDLLTCNLPFFQRNPKIEFCKTDLLKLLTYLEGELQARDIVIATLKVKSNF